MRIACTLNWVKDAVEFNTKFNAKENRYKLKVCNISDKAAKALNEQFGIKPKTGGSFGTYIECKSKFKFFFNDDAGNLVDPTTIGNGTKAIVNITGAYEHNFDKTHGKGPIADSGVVVTELVSYTHVDGGDEEAL